MATLTGSPVLCSPATRKKLLHFPLRKASTSTKMVENSNDPKAIIGASVGLVKEVAANYKLKMRKSASSSSTAGRKGPLIAKHPPSFQLTGSNTTTTETVIPKERRACRTPSPVSPTSRRSGSPLPSKGGHHLYGTNSNKRGQSPPTAHGTQTRKRSPSVVARSRPSSPSNHGASRRLPSPCSLDPATVELIRCRVRRVQKARLYLLQQPGPNSFLVGSDSPDHKYKVTVGPQSCSCGRGPSCVHVLFIMLRVFQVPESDPRIIAKELKNYEVESLFRQYKERCTLRMSEDVAVSPHSDKYPSGASSPNASDSCVKNADEEEVCPICLLEMVEGESLVSCKYGCRNKLHQHCISIWAAERRRQGDPVVCPLCRAAWGESLDMSISSGYKSDSVNVADSPIASPVTPDKHSFLKSRPDNSKRWNAHHSKSPVSQGATSPTSHGFPSTVNTFKSNSHTSVSRNTEKVLPQAEPIPDEHKHVANAWIKVFGTELATCLFSRDWVVRETALRRLMHEMVSVLHYESMHNIQERSAIVICCCSNILAMVAADPVYKVYLGCLRCLRALLAYAECRTEGRVVELQMLLRPVIHTVLLKCADGNRRTSQLSLDCLKELSKGQQGELALGKHSSSSPPPEGLGGIEFVLDCILEEYEVDKTSWQWLLGRLVVLEHLLETFPGEFALRYIPLYTQESGYKLANYNRLMLCIEFAYRALRSSHATVAKMARHVFVALGKQTAVEPGVYCQVVKLLDGLDPGLQRRLKCRLQMVVDGRHMLHGSFSPNGKQRQCRTPNSPFDCMPRSTSRSPPRKSTYALPQRPNYLPLNQPHSQLFGKQHHQEYVSRREEERSPKTVRRRNIAPFKSEVATPCTPSAPRSTPVQENPVQLDENIILNAGITVDHLLQSDHPADLPPPLVPGLAIHPITNAVHSQEKDMESGNTSEGYKEGIHWIRGHVLGTGAFSNCYQARDVKTGTLMAVKEVPFKRNTLEEQERTEGELRKEIAMMSRLSHPNVVRILGATQQDGCFKMFVEWMAGGSVASLLDKYGSFTEDIILRYTKQVLGGLAYLHDNQILHRDLKGANLLVDSTGHHLRIGDFGAAARLASQATVTGEFQGQVLGTIAFMAPEVVRGEDYGRLCDIWSVGCCMIEMATTKPPWNAHNVSNHLALIYKIACCTSPPPIPEHLSAATRELALQCLKVETELRPPAKQLLQHPVFNSTDIQTG